MRLSIFKIIIFFFFLCSFSLKAQEEEKKNIYSRRVEKHLKFWQKMTPKYTKLQFAGSIGVMSIGTGWNYGKNHWETDALIGIVPKNADKHAMLTFTLKQNYIPWQIPINDKIVLEPLSCGLYFNTLLDRDFWVSNPDKYPNGYYTFSTKLRTHVFLGERITFNLNPDKWAGKSITVFYELSTCDLYLITAVGNHILKPRDYLSLSFGIKMQIL